MKRKFENVELLDILNRLRKNKTPMWQTVRKILSLPARRRTSVNISKLSKLARKGKEPFFIVPGKVLGAGVIKNKFKVINFECSNSAADKMKSAGCENYKLSEIIDNKGKVKIKGQFIIVR